MKAREGEKKKKAREGETLSGWISSNRKKPDEKESKYLENL